MKNTESKSHFPTNTKPDLYTSGQFAKKAHVSIRTIRYYDQQNILKPTYINESGARFYSDSDFAHLQQVLLLKYLGFSLEEIRSMTIGDSDYHILLNSLHMQQKLVKDRIAQMQLVDQAITNTTNAIQKNHSIDWSSMLDLIHLTNMESSFQTQYQNASNISARINLHTLYSTNKEGWFPWVFREIMGVLYHPETTYSKHPLSGTSDASSANARSADVCSANVSSVDVRNVNPNKDGKFNILELGCGDGSLWVQNYHAIPSGATIVLSDISSGMLRDARRNIDAKKAAQNESAYEKAISPKAAFKFKYKAFDCAKIPYEDQSFDLIIANHVLFYCDDLNKVLSEVCRVLKPGGCFVCSTYGADHMQEINQLVEKFDERIVLSSNKLYDNFGLENGIRILTPYFKSIGLKRYEDALVVDQPEPLIDYILSCHGNQNQYLLNRYTEFKAFLSEQIAYGYSGHKHARTTGSIRITKDAGMFVCKMKY